MSAIVWEDPASGRRGNTTDWAEFLAPLTDDPGRWARIAVKDTPSNASSQAQSLKRHAKVPGRWEFVSRKLADGTGAVYARYLGAEVAA